MNGSLVIALFTIAMVILYVGWRLEGKLDEILELLTPAKGAEK